MVSFQIYKEIKVRVLSNFALVGFSDKDERKNDDDVYEKLLRVYSTHETNKDKFK